MDDAENLPPCPPGYTPEEWASYNRDPCSWCIKELRNPDPEVRCNAADILRGLGWDAVDAIPALTEGCRDPDGQVRTYCAHALAEIGYDVHSRRPDALPVLNAAVPALTELLSDSSMDTRCCAIQALKQIGAAAKSAAPALRRLLNDPEAEVREASESALAKIER
jgi:HEAT repeat protein